MTPGRRARPPASRRKEFDDTINDVIPASLSPALIKLKEQLSAEKPKAGTRKMSEKALDVINGELQNTVGGSADLTPSNNTKTKGLVEISPGNFNGRYIHYGIREHGMARGHERHGAAWRRHSLWRHLHGVQRLLPPRHPSGGADGHPRGVRDDP